MVRARVRAMVRARVRARARVRISAWLLVGCRSRYYSSYLNPLAGVADRGGHFVELPVFKEGATTGQVSFDPIFVASSN